jgi:opacity protein-like surface antigen
MKTTMLAIAAAIAAGTLAHAQDAVQWRVEDGGNGHWYLFVDLPETNWADCHADALLRGGELAITPTADEWNIVRVAFGTGVDPTKNFFLGAERLPSADWAWYWIDGTPVGFAPWISCAPNNPQSGHVVLHSSIACNSSDLNWDDATDGSWEMAFMGGYVIEFSADCNGDGIVDYGQILDGTLEDANGNGVPDCCDEGVDCDPCLGDVNFDGIVNGADISVLLGFWGLNGKPVAADINKDGSVDGADLAAMLGGWGECP